MIILEIETKKRIEAIDITEKIQEVIKNFNSGVVFIYSPHTTAGITINEGFDEDVMRDLNNKLNELIPKNGNYFHIEGNSDAHIKTSLIGNEVFLFIENGKLILGTWQKVFFLEFDGPRKRKVFIKILT